MIENERVNILWNFQVQIDKLVMANQPDIVVVDKRQRAAEVDVAIPGNSSIRKKEHEKFEKYQGCKGSSSANSDWGIDPD